MSLKKYKYISKNFFILSTFSIIVSIVPINLSNTPKGSDLLFHFIFFFIFSIFCENKNDRILIFLIPILTESIQFFLPYRNFNFYDLLSDYFGIISGIFFYNTILKNPERRFIFVGSFFYLGYVIPKMKGTFSSFLILNILIFYKLPWFTLSILFIFTYILHYLLKDFLYKKDPDFFTLDEVIGTFPIFYLQTEIFLYVFYFILYRFFDIKKPLFIKNIEKIHNFNGVFLDDFLSGIYSLFITLLIHFVIQKIFL
ncbi:MAG: phosphatidylglycerophosphatase A [Candidatus Hydrothermales bacterium]